MDAYRALTEEWVTVDFYPDSQLLVVRWNEKTELIESDQEFIAVSLKIKNVYETFEPDYILYDQVNMLYTITPQLQKWINDNMVSTLIKIGVKKVAFLLSKDLFARISVQQVVEEEAIKKLKVRFFEDEEEARKWLFS